MTSLSGTIGIAPAQAASYIEMPNVSCSANDTANLAVPNRLMILHPL